MASTFASLSHDQVSLPCTGTMHARKRTNVYQALKYPEPIGPFLTSSGSYCISKCVALPEPISHTESRFCRGPVCRPGMFRRRRLQSRMRDRFSAPSSLVTLLPSTHAQALSKASCCTAASIFGLHGLGESIFGVNPARI